ncbi:putative uncharacterized protein DDB_G0282133 [Rhopalosiphum maidis]|uniref:putative uncharacterized protein DDB_G0282133 n=1 Tax=Rhopalosiphum maidis TaxID=43146 RepID=UPI000F00688D|nr:putative uncharacterized protein DDB_G0282133 [Rhopalosiphum maidis]
MLFAFMLTSALAVSAVLGRSSGTTPTQITYMKEEQVQGQIDESAQVVAVGDRSSNLKYVMAIQSSSIWTDIKQRSLTINSPQRLDDAVAEKSPNDLSDEELAKLKQACHDGLKCVAVDQLLVLKRVRESLGDGNTSVRMAITKITQVITEYTTEYHEDVYQYEEVTQSDDPSKVYESVTNIVEDNKELCQIDVSAVETGKKNTTESPKKNEVEARPATIVNNNNTVNYNTTNNYNINDGTINSANINLVAPKGTDGVSIAVSTDDSPAVNEPENRSPNDADQRSTYRTAADSSSPTGNESSVAGSPENGAAHERVRRNVAQDDRQENASANDSRPPTQLMITDAPHDDNAHDSAGRPKAIRARPDGARKPVTDNTASVSNGSNVDGGNSGRDTDRTAGDDVSGNTATIVNSSGGGSGDNDSDADIVSAGSGNREDIKKGLVEDGYFNNGNMKVKNFDRSNRNKGTIKNSSADQGIIGIGTINNGPVNYGTSNSYNNQGTVADIGNLDIQEYATSIDKMYSAILSKLANRD